MGQAHGSGLRDEHARGSVVNDNNHDNNRVWYACSLRTKGISIFSYLFYRCIIIA